MGQPNRLDEMPLQPQFVVEPFNKWALEFVGPINPPSKQKVYILVQTDYMTKRVEATAPVRATDKFVVDFLFEEIFTNFGVPKEIATDGGPQLVSHKFEAVLHKYHIQHRITSPQHPQANGQVESTNKVIESILTKTVRIHCKDWADKLLEALWAYRTTWRNTTGFSPYDLVYGNTYVFSIEFEIKYLNMAMNVNLDVTEA